MKPLKPFQLTAVDFLTSRANSLLADSMGLGKTYSAIGAINSILLPTHILIVCPASIKKQWQSVLLEQSQQHLPIFIVNGRDATIPTRHGFVIINYDLLSSSIIMEQLKKVVWDVGVFDEVHYCKSMDAKRTKAVFGKQGLVHYCNKNILLTGTPILNRPAELFPMLKVLAPDVLGAENTFEKFALKFCNGWFDGRGFNASGHSNEEELKNRLTKRFMLRRTEEEVLSQLPEKRYQIYLIDGDTEKLKQLEELTKKDFKHQRFDTDTPIATLRRELAEKKTVKSFETIEDIIDQTNKLVIFVYHKSVVDLLMRKFKAVKIDGSCTSHQREEALRKFRTTDIKVLVGQITAAGQGLDGMQDVCNHVLFLESSWTPAEIDQAVARVARMGQTKSVLIQFIVWGKSVEEHQLRVALDKRETIKKIVG